MLWVKPTHEESVVHKPRFNHFAQGSVDNLKSIICNDFTTLFFCDKIVYFPYTAK